MIEIIKKILKKWSCLHKWEKKVESPTCGTPFKKEGELPYKIRQTYICSTCGKFKQINL